MRESDFVESLQRLYGTPVPEFSVRKLLGDASSRMYFRVSVRSPSHGPSSAVIMQLPMDASASDEGGPQPNVTRLPFLEVADLLRAAGIRVPRVYVEHLARGQLVLEDLGDTTLEKALRATPSDDWGVRYAQAVALLAELHDRCETLPPSSIVTRRRFDAELLNWELAHFREWGLEAVFGPLDPDDGARLSSSFETLAAEIEKMPYGFVHRDFQSKNLMVGPEDQIALIDFQDAMRGPRTYDLVALLCDSYVSLDLVLQDAMIERYAAARRLDPQEIRREFWLVALHRKLKDAGRFVFIDRKRRNPTFLQWYPQSLVYVERALTQSGRFSELGHVLRARIPGFPGAVDPPASVSE